MIAAIAAISLQWGKDILRNVMLWLMLALPTGIAWAVMQAQGAASQEFGAIWLVFAQLMAGIMVASGHWLEEREQGTWQALRLSPVPIGWLLFAQGALITLLTLISELLVFWVNHGVDRWSSPLVVSMLFGAALASFLGVLIGIASRSARAGNMLATVVMMVLFLGAITAPGLSGYPALHAMLHWLPSILAAASLSAGLAGYYPPASTNLALALWLLAVIVSLGIILRRQYRLGS